LCPLTQQRHQLAIHLVNFLSPVFDVHERSSQLSTVSQQR
jgi:hypothetical protein